MHLRIWIYTAVTALTATAAYLTASNAITHDQLVGAIVLIGVPAILLATLTTPARLWDVLATHAKIHGAVFAGAGCGIIGYALANHPLAFLG